MPMSRNPRRYADCQKVLDVALAKGECLVSFKKPGQAIAFRQRLYHFQKIMENLSVNTEYTGFRISPDEADPCILRIVPYSVESAGATIITSHEDVEFAPEPENRADNPLSLVEQMMKDEGLLP